MCSCIFFDAILRITQATAGNHLSQAVPGNHRQPLNHFTLPTTTFTTITAAITTTAATNMLLGQ